LINEINYQILTNEWNMAKHKTENEDANVISIYLKEINTIPLLTREEEDYYAQRSRDGDPEAKKALVKANLRFVVNVAKKYQNQGLPLLDLISEGNIGLISAIEKFDVNRGCHFISYAVWWIRQSILKAICEKSRIIKLPLNKANEVVKIERARKEILKSKGIDATIAEIAHLVNMSEDEVESLINISRELISLETPVYVERDSSLLGDLIESKDYKSPDDMIIEKSLHDDIVAVLQTLTPKEADIIKNRFGLDGVRPLSLKEIGEKYKLSKERIRQIEKKALKRLKHPSRSDLLKIYLAE